MKCSSIRLHVVRSLKTCIRVLIFLGGFALKHYFSKLEIILWSSSVLLIVGSFCIFERENVLTLIASLIGVTSLIFNAKGNPFGQLLTVALSLLYGIISYSFAYYGEMITYLGMTMPMAVFVFISWRRQRQKRKGFPSKLPDIRFVTVHSSLTISRKS